jgi:hypothetical protein
MFDVRDIIRYNTGWLAILFFRAKGTDWYLGVPCYRDQISANLAGQKLLRMLDQ